MSVKAIGIIVIVATAVLGASGYVVVNAINHAIIPPPIPETTHPNATSPQPVAQNYNASWSPPPGCWFLPSGGVVCL